VTTILWEGFESGEWTHDCRVFPVEGEPHDEEIGEIFTPRDWTFWFVHDPGNWDQPEASYCWKKDNDYRVHEGEGAYKWFTFWRRHDAGLMRRIRVTPGTRLRLTARAHAWSNTNLSGHEDCTDEPHCSCGVGTEIVSIPFDGLPMLTGDPWNDAVSNFLFQVGVDPKGGDSPFSESVIWGECYAVYNGYCQELSVETTAQSDKVTIFLRSSTLYPFKHNDCYWDSVELTTVDDTDGERGAPRTQYERTYVLMPPDVTIEEVHDAVDEYFPDRRTIGFSADDAGIGDLDMRRVLAIEPGRWADDLEAFFAEHYPGVEYIPVETEKGESILFCQCDSPWASEKLAGENCDKTICQQGCWVCDCASALRHYRIDDEATPSTVNQKLGSDGFSGCDCLHSAMKTKLGLEVVKKSYSDTEAQDWLAHDVCLAEILPTDYQHFVLVTRVEDERYWMLDPWLCQEGWLDESYEGVESWRLIQPVQKDTPPEPSSPQVTASIGPHCQTLVGGVWEYVEKLRSRVVKVFCFEDVDEFKRRSPDTRVVVRHYTDYYDDLYAALATGGPLAAGRLWVDKFRGAIEETAARMAALFPDDPKRARFWVEGPNELYPSLNESAVKKAAALDLGVCLAIQEMNLNVGPAVFCAAVGNPDTSEYKWLVDLGRACEDTGGMMGYHTYWPVNHGVGGPDTLWPYLAGRWTEIDEVLVSHGIHVHWYGGESGAIGSEWGENTPPTGVRTKARSHEPGQLITWGPRNHPVTLSHDAKVWDRLLDWMRSLLPSEPSGWVWMNPAAGWRDSSCYDGDWESYLIDIVRMDELNRQWNATHGGRKVGDVLFTCGQGIGWENFLLWQTELESLTVAMEERYG